MVLLFVFTGVLITSPQANYATYHEDEASSVVHNIISQSIRRIWNEHCHYLSGLV